VKMHQLKYGTMKQVNVSKTLREHTGMVNYISFSPNGENMASCARDMTY